MPDERSRRKLAAILAADVVGYSRMMGADEEGTLAALRRHREIVFNPLVAGHNGRVVKLIGDGTLVEFSSAVDAVRCAIEIQQQAKADIQPAGPSIVLRIGVNLGDVIVDGDDIYGDGVNIAARLEPLADPGGICIASIVHDNVSGRVGAAFTDGGDAAVKNIERSIRIWKWRPEADVAAGTTAPVETNVAGTAKAPPADLKVPGKPSIAVLPFTNISGDPEQDYFADGITEDIITALSRIHWFFVIARNTTFTYKGVAFDVQKVAAELGVRYVLEGSVRRSGGRIRVTAQLIDGDNGNHLWAEKYDRDLKDVFDIQDEITENIAGALEPQIVLAENIRSRRKNPQNLDAWDLFIQAMAKIGEFSREGSDSALELLDRAIAIDPGYARAYSQKAWMLAWRTQQGWEDVASAVPAAVDASDKAIRYDPGEAWAYIARIFTANLEGDREKMRASATKAVELNPNFALAHSFLGVTYALTGEGARAFEWIEKARRLSPRDMFRDEFELHTSLAYFQIGDYWKSIEFASRASMPRPQHVYPHLMMATCYGHLGEDAAAKATLASILRLVPDFSLTAAEKVCIYLDRADRLRFLEGLRRAGIPD